MRTDFSNYLFRCHTLGTLMTGAGSVGLTPAQQVIWENYNKRNSGEGRPLTDNQKKDLGELTVKKFSKPKLSKTTQTELKKLHKQELFKRRKKILTKALEKGTLAEELSADTASIVMQTFLKKNKERKSNDYFTGEADNAQGKIRDFKTSWDFDTFPLYEKEPPDSNNKYQVHGYMDLWEMDQSEVIYVLVDTPTKLINDELRRLDWDLDVFDLYGGIKEKAIPLVVEKVSSLIYTHEGLVNFCKDHSSVRLEWFDEFIEIPEVLRVKSFDFDRDDNLIASIKVQCDLSRKYLNSLSISISEALNGGNNNVI